MNKIFYKNKDSGPARNATHNVAGGYAVLELLFYISFFAVISLVVINAMIIMTKSFKETSIHAEFVQSEAIMERISREIRQAYAIDGASTTTDLKLNTKDVSDVNKTIEFKFVSPNIELWDAGINAGNLNSPNMVVTGVTFTQITTARGKAIKVVISIRSSNDTLARVQNLYDTVVLRGAY